METSLRDSASVFRLLSLSCDASKLAGVNPNGTLHLLSLADNQERVINIEIPKEAQKLSFAVNEPRLLAIAGVEEDTICIEAHDVTGPRSVFAEQLACEDGSIVDILLCSKFLVSAFQDFAVLWELDFPRARWRQLAVLDASEPDERIKKRITATKLSHTGETLLLGFDNGEISLWSLRSLSPIAALNLFSTKRGISSRLGYASLDICPNLNRLCAIDCAGRLLFANLQQKHAVHTAEEDGKVGVPELLGRPVDVSISNSDATEALVLYSTGQLVFFRIETGLETSVRGFLVDSYMLKKEGEPLRAFSCSRIASAGPTARLLLDPQKQVAVLVGFDGVTEAFTIETLRRAAKHGSESIGTDAERRNEATNRLLQGNVGRTFERSLKRIRETMIWPQETHKVLQQGRPLFKVARELSGSASLHPKRLRRSLGKVGRFPDKWRAQIWKLLLRLPECAGNFASLIRQGPHPIAQKMMTKVPSMKSSRAERKLQLLLSAFSHWCPALAESTFLNLPAVVFPMVMVFERDELAAFECSIAFFCRWGANWLISTPLPPVPLLRAADFLLASEDAALSRHFNSFENPCNASRWCWPLLRDLLTPRLQAKDWLHLMDHVFAQSRTPSFLVACLIAVVIHPLKKEELLRCSNNQEVFDELHTHRPVRIRELLEHSYRVHKHMPTIIRSYLDGKALESLSVKNNESLRNIDVQDGRKGDIVADFRLFYDAFPPNRLPWPIPQGSYPLFPRRKVRVDHNYQRRMWHLLNQEHQAAEASSAQEGTASLRQRAIRLQRDKDDFDSKCTLLNSDLHAHGSALADHWYEYVSCGTGHGLTLLDASNKECTDGLAIAHARRKELETAMGIRTSERHGSIERPDTEASWISAKVKQAEEGARKRLDAVIHFTNEALDAAEEEARLTEASGKVFRARHTELLDEEVKDLVDLTKRAESLHEQERLRRLEAALKARTLVDNVKRNISEELSSMIEKLSARKAVSEDRLRLAGAGDLQRERRVLGAASERATDATNDVQRLQDRVKAKEKLVEDALLEKVEDPGIAQYDDALSKDDVDFGLLTEKMQLAVDEEKQEIRTRMRVRNVCQEHLSGTKEQLRNAVNTEVEAQLVQIDEDEKRFNELLRDLALDMEAEKQGLLEQYKIERKLVETRVAKEVSKEFADLRQNIEAREGRELR